MACVGALRLRLRRRLTLALGHPTRKSGAILMSEETIHVFLFRQSFGPFIELLNEHKVKYSMRQMRTGVVMAGPGGALEILQSTAMWGAIAAVLVAYINSRRGREVMITLKNNAVVHAKGLSMEELEQVLQHAESMAIIDTSKDEQPEKKLPPLPTE
jgi:hypothetical protein